MWRTSQWYYPTHFQGRKLRHWQLCNLCQSHNVSQGYGQSMRPCCVSLSCRLISLKHLTSETTVLLQFNVIAGWRSIFHWKRMILKTQMWGVTSGHIVQTVEPRLNWGLYHFNIGPLGWWQSSEKSCLFLRMGSERLPHRLKHILDKKVLGGKQHHHTLPSCQDSVILEHATPCEGWHYQLDRIYKHHGYHSVGMTVRDYVN